MNKKIIFLDVDGTLVGKRNEVPESARKAIELARKNGHLVYICTGRSKAEISDDIKACELNGMIGGNGGYVETDGEVIFHKVLTEAETKGIVDWLFENDLGFYLEANSGLYPSPGYLAKVKAKYPEEADLHGFEVFVNSMVDTSKYKKEDYYRNDLAKISYLLNSRADSDACKAKFPELKHNIWAVGSPMEHGDVGVKGIDKKFAIEVLLKHLGANKEDTISFGDETVDIPMFEATGYGVAVGGASEDLKAVANYITTDTDDDGIYNAFKHLGLID